MRKMLALVAVCVMSAGVTSAQGSSAGTQKVTINYRQSSCAQRPFAETGQVRFFVRLSNTSSRAAAFKKNIRFLWLRPDGWKDSWLNSIDGGSLKVPAGRGKTYFTDFGADPTKLILRCALRIGVSSQLHFVKVLR